MIVKLEFLIVENCIPIKFHILLLKRFGKAELEKAKAGDATGVEIAQKNYDKIAAKLAAAITELEAAAAALEAAIAEVTPVTE